MFSLAALCAHEVETLDQAVKISACQQDVD